jgi:DNA-binding CsgD family transcriptional regulator
MLDPEDPDEPPRLSRALFAFILLVLIADLIADWRAHTPFIHMGLEIVAGGLALLGVAVLALRARADRARMGALRKDLHRAQEQARRWADGAQDTLRSLRSAIDGQFDQWELTPAERSVAFLLVRGLRLKEIATQRNTSERTVRQQALAIYRKAGVEGRTELAGFFLTGIDGRMS